MGISITQYEGIIYKEGNRRSSKACSEQDKPQKEKTKSRLGLKDEI